MILKNISQFLAVVSFWVVLVFIGFIFGAGVSGATFAEFLDIFLSFGVYIGSGAGIIHFCAIRFGGNQ